MRHSEDKIQQDCFEWYNNNYCLAHHKPRQLIYHVPNENQQKLTKIGVVAGIPDLVILHNGEHIYFEMKDHKGVLSKEQIKIRSIIEAQNVKWFLCRSLESFKEIIKTVDK